MAAKNLFAIDLDQKKHTANSLSKLNQNDFVKLADSLFGENFINEKYIFSLNKSKYL